MSEEKTDKKKEERAYTRKEWEGNTRLSVQTGESTQFSIKKKKFYFSF